MIPNAKPLVALIAICFAVGGGIIAFRQMTHTSKRVIFVLGPPYPDDFPPPNKERANFDKQRDAEFRRVIGQFLAEDLEKARGFKVELQDWDPNASGGSSSKPNLSTANVVVLYHQGGDLSAQQIAAIKEAAEKGCAILRVGWPYSQIAYSGEVPISPIDTQLFGVVKVKDNGGVMGLGHGKPEEAKRTPITEGVNLNDISVGLYRAEVYLDKRAVVVLNAFQTSLQGPNPAMWTYTTPRTRTCSITSGFGFWVEDGNSRSLGGDWFGKNQSSKLAANAIEWLAQ